MKRRRQIGTAANKKTRDEKKSLVSIVQENDTREIRFSDERTVTNAVGSGQGDHIIAQAMAKLLLEKLFSRCETSAMLIRQAVSLLFGWIYYGFECRRYHYLLIPEIDKITNDVLEGLCKTYDIKPYEGIYLLHSRQKSKLYVRHGYFCSEYMVIKKKDHASLFQMLQGVGRGTFSPSVDLLAELKHLLKFNLETLVDEVFAKLNANLLLHESQITKNFLLLAKKGLAFHYKFYLVSNLDEPLSNLPNHPAIVMDKKAQLTFVDVDYFGVQTLTRETKTFVDLLKKFPAIDTALNCLDDGVTKPLPYNDNGSHKTFLSKILSKCRPPDRTYRENEAKFLEMEEKGKLKLIEKIFSFYLIYLNKTTFATVIKSSNIPLVDNAATCAPESTSLKRGLLSFSTLCEKKLKVFKQGKKQGRASSLYLNLEKVEETILPQLVLLITRVLWELQSFTEEELTDFFNKSEVGKKYGPCSFCLQSSFGISTPFIEAGQNFLDGIDNPKLQRKFRYHLSLFAKDLKFQVLIENNIKQHDQKRPQMIGQKRKPFAPVDPDKGIADSDEKLGDNVFNSRS